MDILGGLGRIFEMLQSQILNIPIENIWGYIYVVLNAVLLLFGSFFQSPQ